MNKKAQVKLVIIGIVLVGIFSICFVVAGSFNPEDNRDIGYEFLDDGKVVHIWNTQDDYFFNKSSGIQFTNHFQDYWTKNIFCLGYYQSGTWHKIGCADELIGFNKNIETDNLTYVNITLWKDFNYGSYGLRLGVRYHLKLNDEKLSVMIYGKNTGIDFPYDLGFAWKVTDWEIPHEGIGGDSININNTDYRLNGTYNLLFKNITKTITQMDCDCNTTNETNCSYRDEHIPIPFFMGFDYENYLRIDWNENLNYAVKMYGDGNQSNFYTALLINAGEFKSGVSKSTTFYWIDAITEIDYFNRADNATVGNNWVEYETCSGCANQIISNRLVVDRNPGGPGTSYTEKDVTADTQYNFTIQYDDTGDNGWEVHLRNKDTGNPIIYVSVTTSKFSYYAGAGVVDTGVSFSANTDYTFSFRNVDNSAHTLDLWIGGSEIATGIAYENNEDVTRIRCRAGRNGATSQFDSISRGLAVDTTKPTYSNNQTNTTIAGAFTLFSVLYDDDTALEPDGDWIFSTNNSGGTWTNDSPVSFTATPNWSNVTKILNSTGGLKIGYQWYANDSAGNWNNTPIYILTTAYIPQNYTMNVTQPFTTTSLTDRTGSLKKDIPQLFTINSLVEKIKDWWANIPQDLSIINLVDRIGSLFRDIPQILNINILVDRLTNLFKHIPQVININALTDRLTSSFRNIPQSFTINELTSKIKTIFKTITQLFTINSLIDRIKASIRTITQSFTINALVEKVTSIANRISTDYFRVIVNYPQSFVQRIVSFFRNPFDILNFNALIERIASLFKKIIQSFNINAIVEKIRKVLRTIVQFFQMLFGLLSKGTFSAWNWITSVETTTQLPATEGLRVPYEFNDNWTVSASSPENWTNVNKTYNLPTDCANVRVEIDGENRTGSNLVNNTLCNYTVRNNNTLEPTNTSLINITYTTTAITSSEGSWLAYNKRLYNQTRWRNTLTLSNPSTHNYANISINITSDKNAIPASVKVINSTDTFSHTFNNSNGNINWTLASLDSGDNEIFTIDYNTTKINITKVNHSDTILGKEYTIYNVTINTNSSRSILSVYSFFNFSDTGIISNKLYRCTGGLTNCTEDISNRADLAWSDLDGDGYYDFVEWYITNLTTNQSYQLYNDKGFPIEITETSEILNKPIFAFSNILWRTTITMYNPNAFSTEKVYKYEFPLGSADIELDDISKNLQFDPFGGLAPHLTIVDKSQIGDFPNSVYLSPGETKTFIVKYRTESVTVHASTYFPTYFEVGENALIIQTLRIHNQAEDFVEDIEYRIRIDFAESLLVCKNERKEGCIEDKDDPQYDNLTIDTQEEVKGDYTLEIENISSGETKYITLSYKIPTAIVEKIERGKRSVQGVLADYKKVTIISTAPYTMKDLRYKETEIKVGNVIDVFECNIPLGICDIPLVYTNMEIKLKTVGIGERKEFYIWHMGEGESKEYESWFDDALDWFVENVWNGGRKIQLEEGTFLYYLLGWISSTDPTTGEIYVPIGRLIVIGSVVGLLIGFVVWWFVIRRRRKLKKERAKTFI